MEYRIVKANYADQLEDAVSDAINDGWVPQGGVFVSSVYVDDYRFFQVVTKSN